MICSATKTFDEFDRRGCRQMAGINASVKYTPRDGDVIATENVVFVRMHLTATYGLHATYPAGLCRLCGLKNSEQQHTQAILNTSRKERQFQNLRACFYVFSTKWKRFDSSSCRYRQVFFLFVDLQWGKRI